MRRVFIGVFIRLTWFHPLLLLMPLIRFLLDYIFLVFEDSLVLYCRLSAHARTHTLSLILPLHSTLLNIKADSDMRLFC